ncbi:hypothetical protein ACWGCW_31505 [Streptomyces sp. NPDC054933]
MSIISTTSKPFSPEGVSDGLTDTVAEAFSVFEEVQDLAKLGVQVSVTVSPDSITADVTVIREAAGLLPILLRELDDTNITRTQGGARIVGTMYQRNVTMQIAIPSAFVKVADLDTLLSATELDSRFTAAHGADRTALTTGLVA